MDKWIDEKVDFLNRLEGETLRLFATLVRRYREYGGGIRKQGKITGVTPVLRILTRLEDKMDRLSQMGWSTQTLHNHRDTITDIAGYCILLLCLMEDDEQ